MSLTQDPEFFLKEKEKRKHETSSCRKKEKFMTMIKLTVGIREGTAKHALQHRFSTAVAEQVKAQHIFSRAVYEDVYDEATRRKMKALPEGWLGSQSHWSVRFGGQYEQIHFDGQWNIYAELRRCLKEKELKELAKLPSSYLVLAKDDRDSAAKIYDGRHPLTEQYQALDNARKDLEKQVAEAKALITSALNSVTTLARVVENWPELEPFTRNYAVVPQQALTVRRESLNKVFELPVS